MGRSPERLERARATWRSKVVAPGFIDVHTHDDRALFATPEMAAKASQGVTTVVTGNCGISLAPLSIDHAPPPPLDLIGDAADYRYGRFADYLRALDRPGGNQRRLPCRPFDVARRLDDRTRPAGRGSRDRANGRIVAGSARRRRGWHVERPRLRPGEHAPAAEIEALAALLRPAARSTRRICATRATGARQPRRKFRGRSRGRCAGRDLAPQDDRAENFGRTAETCR